MASTFELVTFIVCVWIASRVLVLGQLQFVPGRQPIAANPSLLLQPSHPPKCLMRGLCPPGQFKTQVGRNWPPCHAPESTPYIPDSKSRFVRDLEEACPHFFDEDGSLKEPVCCDDSLKKSMRLILGFTSGLALSCPSCEWNAKLLFCNLFCSPHQSSFARVTQTTGQTVDKVQYFVHESFANRLYSSCQDVSFAGLNVVDQICGHWGRKGCTPERFLIWLGMGGTLPATIDFVVSNTTQHRTQEGSIFAPMTSNDAVDCNEAAPDRDACSCSQCPKSCQLT